MFTGIVEAVAEIMSFDDDQLVVQRPDMFDDIEIGSSICVSGVCLSVVAFDDATMTFDVMRETRRVSILRDVPIGYSVHLERAMKADGRFEGHIVQGHVDGVGEVVRFDSEAPSPSPSPVPVEGKSMPSADRALGRLRYPHGGIIEFARKMRHKPTQAEAVLWNALRRRQLNGLYFRRQRPIGPHIVDFYCEDLRLAIEVDGGIHNSSEQKESDEFRDQDLLDRKVRVFRFSNDEVLNNLDAVLSDIRNFALQCPPPPAKGGGVRGGGVTLTVRPPSHLFQYIVSKGSIAINGVSLTVASVEKETFSVALIPHTIENTNLSSLFEGDQVNLETDVLGKYVFRMHNV